jgi:hypothetical protein
MHPEKSYLEMRERIFFKETILNASFVLDKINRSGFVTTNFLLHNNVLLLHAASDSPMFSRLYLMENPGIALFIFSEICDTVGFAFSFLP